jgi:hypothetical protein
MPKVLHTLTSWLSSAQEPSQPLHSFQLPRTISAIKNSQSPPSNSINHTIIFQLPRHSQSFYQRWCCFHLYHRSITSLILKNNEEPCLFVCQDIVTNYSFSPSMAATCRVWECERHGAVRWVADVLSCEKRNECKGGATGRSGKWLLPSAHRSGSNRWWGSHCLFYYFCS